MHYEERTGDYLIAYNDVLEHGGQLYPGNGKDSAAVVVRGNTCITYWAANSKRHQEVKKICDYFGLNSYAKTGGRIARWLIEEELKLPYKDTFWNKQYRELAKSGNHWHYTFVKPFEPFFCIEIDLKSAYISSLLAGKSLLYESGKGYLDDGIAMEYLRAISGELPKWFRLQLLGVLASWRMSFLSRDKGNKNATELVQKYYHKITYQAAFNAVHRAILRNYKIMQKIHQIGGEYIKRIHTDSFFLDIECPKDTEDQIWNYLKDKQVNTSIKGSGKAFFFDLNTGFIGKRFVGAKIDVSDLMREHGVKMLRSDTPPQILDRYGKILEKNQETSISNKVQNEEEKLSPIQLELLLA